MLILYIFEFDFKINEKWTVNFAQETRDLLLAVLGTQFGEGLSNPKWVQKLSISQNVFITFLISSKITKIWIVEIDKKMYLFWQN